MAARMEGDSAGMRSAVAKTPESVPKELFFKKLRRESRFLNKADPELSESPRGAVQN